MTIDFLGLKDIQIGLKEFAQVNDKAIVDAMNRGHTAGVKSVVSAKIGVRKEWNLKSGYLKKRIKGKRATVGRQGTRFDLKSKSISLSEFGGKWTARTKSGKYRTKGASYKLKKKQRTLNHSFMAKGLIFTRKGADRDKIIPHFSITPTSMFLKAEGDDLYINQYFKTFDKRYLQQLEYRASLLK